MSDSVTKTSLPLSAIYVDAVQAHAQLFSCQLIFGAHDLDGTVEPRVHLTLSPTFALQLARVLQDVIEPYTRAPEGIEAAPPELEPTAPTEE